MKIDNHSQSGVHFVPQGRCLITKLAEELNQIPADKLGEVLVVLPTKRISSFVLTNLAMLKGAYITPQMLTLEQFVRSNAQGSDAKSLSGKSEELVIASLLENQNPSFKHLGKGHEHEISELFRQINSVGRGGEIFESLRQCIREDVYRDENFVGSLVERVNELEVLWESFRELLSQQGLSSSIALDTRAAEELLTRWSEDEKLPWKWVYFACFTTVKPYFIPLLQEVAKKHNVSFFLSQAPKLMGSKNPLSELAEHFIGKENVRAPGASSQEDTRRKNTTVIESSTALIEAQQALNLAQAAIKQGCPPAKIGLLISDEKRYGKILTNLVAKTTLETNFAIANGLHESLTGSWLKLLLGLDKTNYHTFIRHPITDDWLHRHGIKVAAIDVSYDFPFSDLIIHMKEAEHTAHTKNQVLYETLVPFLADCMNKSKSNVHTLCEFIFTVAQSFELFCEQKSQRLAINTSEQRALDDYFKSIRAWAELCPQEMSTKLALQKLSDTINSFEIREVGFPLEGVQVLNLVEARYIPFDVAIILGCTEGSFPKSLPNDRLIDDWLKVRIGLSGWQYIEALEDTTFHIISSLAPNLVCCYTQSSDRPGSFRSRFVSTLR